MSIHLVDEVVHECLHSVETWCIMGVWITILTGLHVHRTILSGVNVQTTDRVEIECTNYSFEIRTACALQELLLRQSSKLNPT